jgi:8-oxo-dGTP pyrophosphatase MutT (NUDIX family)
VKNCGDEADLVDKKPELWDILDENGNKTGRTHRRGDVWAEGGYHLVVRAWIINRNGEILITRRALTKSDAPGKWEVPGGSALAGEDGISATMREAREETGIALSPDAAHLFGVRKHKEDFIEHRLFLGDYDACEITLDKSEVIDYAWVAASHIRKQIAADSFWFYCKWGFDKLMESGTLEKQAHRG